MEKIIEIKGLRFAYQAEGENEKASEVLKGIDLEIGEGEFVAVLGHNGSGKSTLAKHLNGILVPTEGKVYVGGIDTADEEKLFELRQCAGMVFQNPDNQIVSSIVEEDVAFGPENLGVASPMIRQRVDAALKQVGMYEYRNHAPHLLSGGQKQRIAIAGIIAMQPKCIVLDEPTAMLDPKGRREVVDTIRRLNKEKNITVILITHHMDEAAKAERVVVLNKGRIALDGSPKEVFSQVEMLHGIGLAAPETVELCWELNKNGFTLPLAQLNAEECAQTLYDAIKV